MRPPKPFGVRLSGLRPLFFSGVALCSLAFVCVGLALAPLAAPASGMARGGVFSAGGGAVAEFAGEGLLAASVGGFRTLIADAFWLRAYVMWERRDRAACSAYARGACALSPDSVHFKKGYATWLAFDFPHWTVRRLGGSGVPPAERDIIHARDSRAALELLREELRRSPDESAYAALAGDIASRKLKDRPLAAEWYRKAAETPAAPAYPAMEYASFLVDSGRSVEAASWMAARMAGRRLGEAGIGPAFAGSLLARKGPDVAESWLRAYAARLPEGSGPAREAAEFLQALSSAGSR